MKSAPSGLRRLQAATVYSLRGLRAAWAGEAAFRQECVVGAILVPAAFVLAETLAQAVLLLAVVALVLIVELLNSAVEAAVDRIGEARHELSARAKDMGSAAVFVSLLVCLATWALVAANRFL